MTRAGSRSRATPVIAMLLVLIALSTAALVLQAATPACAATVARPSSAAQATDAEPDHGSGGWRSAPAVPTARGETGAAVAAGMVVVPGGLAIGGSDEACGSSIASTVVYDPAADAWSERTPMPGPRDHAAVAGWAGLVYVSGGGELARGVAHPNLWAYDPGADEWSELPAMPAPRWQHAMVALGGSLYVVGGIIAGMDDHTPIWEFDIAAATWRSDLAPLPTAREHLAAVAADGRVIALGGRMGRNLPTVELYDPVTDTWSGGPDLAAARGGFAAAALPDGVHVTGGEDFGTGTTIGSHELLDLGSMTWSPALELPTPRHGVASAVLDDRWYVIAGGRDVGLSVSAVVEVWTP